MFVLFGFLNYYFFCKQIRFMYNILNTPADLLCCSMIDQCWIFVH